MKQKTWLVFIVLLVFGISCQKEFESETTLQTSNAASRNKQAKEKGNFHLEIAVVTDIHYLSPTLLTNNAATGEAFLKYLAQDPKLLAYSSPIFKTVLSQLEIERPDVVLIPGDLTKDGERVSHQEVASYLAKLAAEGIKVFVLPGNHDINNTKASRYDGDNAYPVPTVQATDFSSIYGNFGYNNALERDIHSLSYVAEASDELWILAIDASVYEAYGSGGDVATGRIKPETLSWALSILETAKQKGITVFAMMHHNLVEHYAGQTMLDPGYVIENWQSVVSQLMDAGLKVIFTGHYHANDITAYQTNGKELFDIQTGSLVTPPSPYRIITVKNKHLNIQTEYVQSIPVPLPGGLNFIAYSDAFINQYLDNYFYYFLTGNYGVPAEPASFAAPLFRNAYKAHLAGDEKMPPDQRKKIAELETISAQLAAMATTLWTDLGIRDNQLSLKIE